MLDYASILQGGQQLVPSLRQQLVQDALLDMQQKRFEQEQQDRAAALAQAESAQRKQMEFEDARDRALLSSNPRDLIDLRLRYPEFTKGMKDAFDALDEDNRRDALTSLGTIYERGRAGDYEGAAAALRERVEADREAGQADPADEAVLAALDSPNEIDRKAAIGQIGMILAITSDDFANVYGKLNERSAGPDIQKRVEYYRSIGRDDLAEQALNRAEDPLIQIAGPSGTSVIPRSQALGGTGAQPEGGDPSGSQVVDYSVYEGAAKALGPEGAAMMMQRRGQTVQVQSPDQARSLPKGVRYRTPDGREFVR